MVFDYDELAKIVIFCDRKGGFERGMHYAEFEAVLDRFAPFVEYARRSSRAIYIEVDNTLTILSAVFFTVEFDAKGFIDESWNLPIDKVVRNASNGPDLGAGPIRLACKSQCPIHYFRQHLWDPDISSGQKHFHQLKKLVNQNALSISFREPPTTSRSPFLDSHEEVEKRLAHQVSLQSNTEMQKEYARQLQTSLQQQSKEHRLELTAIENKYDGAIKDLKIEHTRHINKYVEKVKTLQATVNAERQKANRYKDAVTKQSKKMTGLRDYFEHKLDQHHGREEEYAEAIKANYRLETESRVAAATIELKEALQTRDIELMYHNEQEQQLRDEIERLRRENAEFVGKSGDQLLSKMAKKGLSYVTYQTGAGHINVPPAEVSQFLEDPVAYTAAYCQVDKEQYETWLLHYQTPVCHYCDEAGEICGENIERIGIPADFFVGESDRCREHNSLAIADSAIKNASRVEQP